MSRASARTGVRLAGGRASQSRVQATAPARGGAARRRRPAIAGGGGRDPVRGDATQSRPFGAVAFQPHRRDVERSTPGTRTRTRTTTRGRTGMSDEKPGAAVLLAYII